MNKEEGLAVLYPDKPKVYSYARAKINTSLIQADPLIALAQRLTLENKHLQKLLLEKDKTINELHTKCLQALGEPQNTKSLVEAVPTV